MNNPEFTICNYTPSRKNEWDDFVERSKNGTFLLKRDYMDYHADRFADHSLMVYRQGRLYALLPGCVAGDTFHSHAGLTYGGLITDSKATVAGILDVVRMICRRLKDEGISTFRYKAIPHIYHRLPAEEDLYALFRMGASLEARGVSSVIERSRRIKFRDIRKSGIRKARREGLTVAESFDFAPFWDILSRNLEERHGVRPVHSLEEITRLANLFPSDIHLFTVGHPSSPRAGCVVYLTPTVAHIQYIAADPAGKENGALDLLFDTLINDIYKDVEYIDFGISTEDGGHILNDNLIYQKEGFGGRAVVYDIYSIPLHGYLP